MCPPGGHRYIGAEPIGDHRFFALRVNCKPAAVVDLRLIGPFDLNRNPFRISSFLDVQGAAQAKNADQTDVVIQPCSHGSGLAGSQLGSECEVQDAGSAEGEAVDGEVVRVQVWK